MKHARFFPLLAVAVLVIFPSPARGDEKATEGDVTVHEFDPTTGVDTKQESRERGVLYLSPGPFLSIVGGRQPATGVGAEVSTMYFPRGTWQSYGYGGFAQAQLYDGKYGRFALGGQAALANVGVELGLAYRAGDEGFASTLSVHGAIFLSLGVFVMSLRDTMPLNGFDKSHLGFGSETAFTFALKIPFVLLGHDPTSWALFGN